VVGNLVELVAQFVELIGQTGADGVSFNGGRRRFFALSDARQLAAAGTIDRKVGRGEVFDPQLAVVVGRTDRTGEFLIDIGNHCVHRTGTDGAAFCASFATDSRALGSVVSIEADSSCVTGGFTVRN